MAIYELNEKAKAPIVSFNSKYHVAIDMDILSPSIQKIEHWGKKLDEKTKEKISKKIKDPKIIQEMLNQKDEAKDNYVDSIIEEYHNMYARLLEATMEDFMTSTSGIELPEDINRGAFLADFENMMNDVMYAQTRAAAYVPLPELAYGGMSHDQLSEYVNNQHFETQKEVYMKGFEGKSINSIRADVDKTFFGRFSEPEYGNLVSMAQAVKAKNDSRGFWGRFFHPIDSRREKNLLAALCNKSKELYPHRDIEKDIAGRTFLSEKGTKERDAMLVSVQNLKKIEFDPVSYEKDKYNELHEKFKSASSDPEVAREKAEEKYHKNIEPKLKSMYEELEKKNAEALRLDPNAKVQSFDLGAFATSLDLSLVDAGGYQKRFLEEKSENERLMRESEEYKQNVDKFKETFAENGDFESLRDEIGEDFDLMKATFLNDIQTQITVTKEDFSEMLKKDTEDNLKIDAQVESEKVLNVKEIVRDKTV